MVRFQFQAQIAQTCGVGRTRVYSQTDYKMLVFKASQIVNVSAVTERSFPRKNGQMQSEFGATVTAIGVAGAVATIVFTRPKAEDLREAVKGLVAGKSAEIPIITAIPLKAAGEFRASGIAYAA
jgi:hypothetical protein